MAKMCQMWHVSKDRELWDKMLVLFRSRSLGGQVLEEPMDGKSHFGATNFLEVLLNDEKATRQ